MSTTVALESERPAANSLMFFVFKDFCNFASPSSEDCRSNLRNCWACIAGEWWASPLKWTRSSAITRRRSLCRSRSFKVTDVSTNRKPVCDVTFDLWPILVYRLWRDETLYQNMSEIEQSAEELLRFEFYADTLCNSVTFDPLTLNACSRSDQWRRHGVEWKSFMRSMQIRWLGTSGEGVV